MAKSSDHDDRPENDDDEPRDEAAPEGAADDAADEAPDKGAADDAADEAPDKGAADDAADEEAEEAPAAKPAAKVKAAREGAVKGGAAKAGLAKGSAVARRAAAKGGARRVPVQPQPQGGSLGKSMILFLVIIGGLAGAFWYFGRETAGSGAAPKWKVGDKADVEITLVSTDIKDLACWSTDEIKERHCAFESPTKGWSKGDADDTKLLKPYTTTDRVQFLAAGVWSQPALTGGKLPGARFALKCSYTVEGKVKRPGIRWSAEGAWTDRTEDWYAGVVTDCKLLNP